MVLCERVDERFVVSVWEHGAFDSAGLDGLGLQLVFRGVPSDAGGPDYQDALFSFGGREIVRGDIEFHVRSSEWVRHGHHLNAHYNQVVLHVVWEKDTEETVRQDGVKVPVLALDRLAKYLPDVPLQQPALLSHPCESAFRALDDETLKRHIHLAASRRFQERSERFASEIEATSPDDAAYAALLESMGYASNRETFRALSDAAPYSWIMSISPELRTVALLDAAALGERSGLGPPARLSQSAWRLSRLRPGNHPESRLRAISVLLDRFHPSLADGLVQAVDSARRPSDLTRALMVTVSDSHALGKGRADEVAVSTVLPLVAAITGPDGSAESLYARYPSPPSTRWTRTMIDLLADAGRTYRLRSALDHQGLHALYTEHCRHGRTSACVVCGKTGVELR
jgi:hypothetical protein